MSSYCSKNSAITQMGKSYVKSKYNCSLWAFSLCRRHLLALAPFFNIFVKLLMQNPF